MTRKHPESDYTTTMDDGGDGEGVMWRAGGSVTATGP